MKDEDYKYELPEDIREILLEHDQPLAEMIDRAKNSIYEGHGSNPLISADRLIQLLRRLIEAGVLWRPSFIRKLNEARQQSNGAAERITEYILQLETENKRLTRELEYRAGGDHGLSEESPIP